MTFEIESLFPGTPLLRSFIETYRKVIVKEELSGVTIANGRIDVVVLLNGYLTYFDEARKTHIEIPRAVFFPFTGSGNSQIKVGRGTQLINIKCYPHVLTRSAFTGVETSSFLDFRELFAEEEVEKFCDELLIAESFNEATVILDQFFERHLLDEVEGSELVSKVIDFMEQQRNDMVSLAILAEEEGVSVKTLERHFKRRTGLSTRIYRDLIRFQRAARQIKGRGEYKHGDLLEALGNGYYDQSHFVKACRRITGLSPKALFAKFPGELTDFALL